MFDDFVEHAGAAPTSAGGAGGAFVPAMHAGKYEDVSYEGFEASYYSDDEEDPATIETLETGYVSSHLLSAGEETQIFSLGSVQFTLPSALLHLRVAANTLFMALHPLTVILIDLSRPSDLTTIDLPAPKLTKGASAGQAGSSGASVITGIWPDQTGKHLIVGTSSGEAWYLTCSLEGGPSSSSTASQTVEWRRPKTALKALKPSPTNAWTSVAWSPPPPSTSSKPSGREVLFATASGQIHYVVLLPQEDLFKSQERDFGTMYTFAERTPVTGLAWGGGGESGRKAWVLACQEGGKGWVWEGMVNSSGPKWVEELLVKGKGPKSIELPAGSSLDLSSPPPSTFALYSTNPISQQTLNWLTPRGIFHALLTTPTSSPLFENPGMLPFPALPVSLIPLSFIPTEYHYLILYADRVVAVSRLDGGLVWEAAIPLKAHEKPLGLASDPSKKTNWLYTSAAIYEVLVSEEDRDVWRVLLLKREYDEALKFARTPCQKNIVTSAQADAFFEQGRFHQAAAKYAVCSKSFEEVVLRFVDAGERDALRYYLGTRLDKLKKTDLTQRLMIATWLVEIYLSKCNTLEDAVAAEAASQDVESLKLERTMVEDELKQFLQDYHANLDRKTVYDLFLSHGRTDLYIYFATLVKDFGKVVEHWVLEEEWVKAIGVLNRQSSPELHYRFSPVLMRNAPKQTVDCWLRLTTLDPRRLIPALLQQQPRKSDNPSTFATASRSSTTNHAVRYLQHVIFNTGSTDPTVHNLLVTFFCASPDPDDAPLLRFLAASPDDPETERPYFDLDYALRLCLAHGRIEPCVHIYGKMGLYESAVDLALEKGDLELAKINADRPSDDDALRKKLWLRIAKYVVQDKRDIKTAMRFLESTDLLKIEDVLPFFPDFVVIDEFKEEICLALEACGAHIQALRLEMDDATASAEAIRRDIAALKDRFVTVEPDEMCSHCSTKLMTRQFYVFPCQHAFHADCLISQIKDFAPSSTLRRILALQTALVRPSDKLPLSSLDPSSAVIPSRVSQPRALLSSSFDSSAATGVSSKHKNKDAANGVAGATNPSSRRAGLGILAAGDRLRELILPDALATAIGGLPKNSPSTKAQSMQAVPATTEKLEKMREELDGLLAGSCVLCDSVVAGLDKPFLMSGEEEEGEWAI